MSIVVYFHEQDNYGPRAEYFGKDGIAKALVCAAEHRKLGHSHVSISTQFDGHIGGFGVDTVVEGKTPDGEIYDWSKAERAGKPRRNDILKPSLGKRDGN